MVGLSLSRQQKPVKWPQRWQKGNKAIDNSPSCFNKPEKFDTQTFHEFYYTYIIRFFANKNDLSPLSGLQYPLHLLS
jgi:hypothetical protein